MQRTEICPWCGGPLPSGRHHCGDCHKKHLHKKGLLSDIVDEEKEIREVKAQSEWQSKKDIGNYLNFDEACSELHRSRRWLWKVLRAVRKDLNSGELGIILGYPNGNAILHSRYGTLLARELIQFLRHIRKEEIQVRDEDVYISSRIASEEMNCTRRWINRLVKNGKIPGRHDFGRVWVDKRKFQKFREEQRSLPDA